ncbi:MAG: hypothetical protein WA828_14850, partial [Coleofasciculaceae cyanobacterium]
HRLKPGATKTKSADADLIWYLAYAGRLSSSSPRLLACGIYYYPKSQPKTTVKTLISKSPGFLIIQSFNDVFLFKNPL